MTTKSTQIGDKIKLISLVDTIDHDMTVGKEYIVIDINHNGSVIVRDDANDRHVVNSKDFVQLSPKREVTRKTFHTLTVNNKQVTVVDDGVMFTGILTPEEFKAIAAAL